ncbi:iron chaperone [Pedobacter arcticus]|uniref:iron chaperone n=1 Tax=Pedobacter arcticus TaxID=752140 RepID=UPI00030599E8|nr:DUF1801 domain-containing protein [Pedobacter arcticus]
MQQKIFSVDEYIAQFPTEMQNLLRLLRATIILEIPDAVEVISYGIPTYRVDVNLVHFAGYKKHIGFYPGPNALIKFKSKILAFKHSKGAVQFPINKELPLKLVSEITKYVLIQNQIKPSKKQPNEI